MSHSTVFKRVMLVSAISFTVAVSVAPQVHAESSPHWAYSGEAGPENWAKLDAANLMCGSGRNQSPIDLGGFVEADLDALGLDYEPAAIDIMNNGHAIQVGYAPGSTLTVDGRSFELKQFHFHSPSENRIQGRQFPLEAHLVHQSADGDLAVVALLLEAGPANPLLETLWNLVPGRVGDKAALPANLGVSELLPADRDYYRFNGSLTTPPCSEGVLWAVLKQPGSLSKAQVAQFQRMLGFGNNRPVQPVNARAVLQ